MDWVKLATRYYVDDRIEALPDADTEMMFVRGLARAGELERAGFIPADSLPKLARRRRYAASVSALLASGLWTRVDGGYQITGWDHWQDALDTLARRRTTDRERQRRRRAAAREQTRESRDDEPLSRDTSRDVTVPDKEKDLEEVQVGEKTHPPRAREEPPPKCPDHIDDPQPPPCGACADARRRHDDWALATNRARGAARSAAARDQAATNRAAIDACRLCDNRGYTDAGLCTHDPDGARRARRGAELARATIPTRPSTPVTSEPDLKPEDPPKEPHAAPAA